MEFHFKKQYPLEKRKEQLKEIQKDYPNKIPIILERGQLCTINKIIKTKYILSRELTMNGFNKIIRDKLEFESTRALFILANGKYVIAGSDNLGEIYKKYKDKEDGFLYMTYTEEIVFG